MKRILLIIAILFAFYGNALAWEPGTVAFADSARVAGSVGSVDSARAAFVADSVAGDTRRQQFFNSGVATDSNNTYTLYDRLKWAGIVGISQDDSVVIGSVYDGDLNITIPDIIVTFRTRMEHFAARDTTLPGAGDWILFAYEDSALTRLSFIGTDTLLADFMLGHKYVPIARFITDATHIVVYFSYLIEGNAPADRDHYIDETHGELVISGMVVAQGASGSKQLKVSSGEIHYGIHDIRVDSLLSVSINQISDSSMVTHWGTTVDSLYVTGEMPFDSVYDYTNDFKVPVVSGKWYKALVFSFASPLHFEVQMADVASQGNTSAAALANDPPPLTSVSAFGNPVRLYWVTFQAGVTNDFDNAIFTDVRQFHGTSIGGSGITDHGLLTGLQDDDHRIYLLKNSLDDSLRAVDTLDVRIGDFDTVRVNQVLEAGSGNKFVGTVAFSCADSAVVYIPGLLTTDLPIVSLKGVQGANADSTITVTAYADIDTLRIYASKPITRTVIWFRWHVPQ